MHHLLQFRVVVPCKTTVCRKCDFAGARPPYRSVYTFELLRGTYKPARTQVLFSRNR